jgi:hypothetical protein
MPRGKPSFNKTRPRKFGPALNWTRCLHFLNPGAVRPKAKGVKVLGAHSIPEMLAMLTRRNLDVAAGTLLRTWLVKKHQAMLVDFLNALEIPNENGVVEDLPQSVPDAKLKAAVDQVLAKHPQEAVAVYLNAFNGMNEANWPNLKTLLESDARLQLGAH